METPPPEPIDYALTGAAAPPSYRRHRSLESIAGLLLVLGALPAGLLVNLAFYRSRPSELGQSDAIGFAVGLATASLGTLLAWHSRQRIRRSAGELYGITSATIALLGGLCILAAFTVVMLKMILGTR